MLNVTKLDYSAHQRNRDYTRRARNNGRVARQANEATTCIEVQHYLDFKFGASSVDITFPDNSTATLAVGADGRVYVQVPG